MPTFGKSNPRAPKSAAVSSARKPRTSSADKFKAREDGRGGRAPHRIERAEAPRGKRASFFEEGSRKTYGTTDSGAGRSDSRSDSRPSYGRNDRNDSRPSYGNRDDRGGRPSAGRTSNREMSGGREDRGRDWSPRNGEGTGAPV